MIQLAKPKIDFGVLLPTREVVIYDFPISKIYEMAGIAEKIGLDSVWVGDSVVAKPRLDAVSILSALSIKTRDVKLGTAVFLPALRNPVLVAHSFATLDQIASGRIILGLGIAGGRYNQHVFEKECESCGIRFNERVKRMEEVIEIIRMLWEQDEVSYAGKYYKLNNVRMPVKPFKKRRLPIWIACSVSDNGLRRVARLADGWIANIVTPEELQESWNKVAKYAKEFGRDKTQIEPCNYLYVNIDADKRKSYDEADKFLTAYYNTKFTPEILARWGSFGNANDCVQRIESAAATGATTMIIHFASLDPLKKLEIFAKDVLPSFN